MTLFEEEVEDEDMDKWIVWFDDASNTLGHGVGAVLVTPNDQCIPLTTRLGFDCTNNIVEYKVCALGIQVEIDFKVKLLQVYRETKDHKLVPTRLTSGS